MKLFQQVLLLAVLFSIGIQTAVGEIEAIEGKKYPLSRSHGPWMVMVAAIRDVDEERRLTEGLSAAEVADRLVLELRRKGIPAYTYSIDQRVEELASSRANSSRRYVAQHGYISVLAGNFEKNNSEIAQRVLEYIKTKFRPDFLEDPANGGILPKTKGRPSALSRAFITANPLFDGEVRDAEKDSLMLDLNANQKYSLLQNRGNYSLTIATFHGGSVMQMRGRDSDRALGFFERRFGKTLDQCASRAMALTNALRNARKYGYEEDYEAWVLHDKYKSIVTIGSFSSPADPRIRQLISQFGGKRTRDPRTGEDVLAAESFTLPRLSRTGQIAKDSWVFDGSPTVVKVPKI